MKRIQITILICFFSWALIAWKVSAFAVSGTGGNSTNKASAAITIQASLASQSSGNLLIVTIAYDNVTSTVGDDASVSQCEIQLVSNSSVVQTLTKAVIRNQTTSASAGHSTVAIYYCKLTQALTNGTHKLVVQTSPAAAAKAVMVRGFTFGSGNEIGFETPQVGGASGAAAPTLSYSGLTNREYLFVRADAREAEALTSGAVSTNYTIFSNAIQAGTTGGGGASNMSLQSEYRIVTGTSTSTAPNVAGNADIASALVAFYEYTVVAKPRRVTIIQ